MKNLSNYIEKEQTSIFEKFSVFFAFNNEQYIKGCKKVGASITNKVSNIGSGTYVLYKNIDLFINSMNDIHLKGIELDLNENGKCNIIMRELSNYETQISNDLTSVIDCLKDYKISKEEINNVYRDTYMPYCIENDLF